MYQLARDLDIDDLTEPATGRDLLHLVQLYKLEQFMKMRTLDLLRQEVATSSPPVESPAEEVLLANSARTTEVPPKTTEEIIKQKEIEHREYLRRVHFLMGLVTGTIEEEDSETTESRSTLQKFIDAEENCVEED